MKKIYTLPALLFMAMSAFADNYPANGNSNFGGPVGKGSFDVTYNGSQITFKLNKGTNNMNDALVIYLDCQAGGFASTSGFTDAGSGLLKAISGYNGAAGQRSTFDFNSDFSPEYALAFQPGNNIPGSATLVLLTNTTHTLISNPELSNNNSVSAADYSVSIAPADIGLAGTVSFKFICTYISPTAWRSNEAIGDPMTGFDQGYKAYTSATPPLQYASTLPAVFGNFTGSYRGKKAELKWETKIEINALEFDVLKSSNGTSWKSIGIVAAKNSTNGAVYSFTDNNISDAVTYYQLKLIDKDGINSYSPLIILRKDGLTGITILGNPAKSIINLSISNSNASTYRLDLYSAEGRKVASQVYRHGGGSGKINIPVPGYTKGTYILHISNEAGKQTIKIIVE